MKKCRWTVWMGILCALLAAAPRAGAQARQNLALARVIYNTAKTNAKPEGALKEKIDALDREIAEASRAGRTSEMRRLFAKGMTLLSGKEWTDALEFQSSLVIRADAVFVDSSRPYRVHLEQIYAPRIELSGSLTARFAAHKAERAGRALRPGAKVKDLGVVEGVARDLSDEPASLDLDLAGIPDGPALIAVEVASKDRTLGTVTLLVELFQGLEQRAARLESAAAKLPEDRRADVLYPVDYVRRCDLGRIEIGTFSIAAELTAAEATLAALQQGKDPFSGRTGDLERHHRLEGAAEIMPYRVYVPARYTAREAFPLVIALHGLGGNEDSMFDGYDRALVPLAEKHGYLVAAPLGFRVDGGYGFGLFRAADDVAAGRKSEYSERDVMAVVALMRKSYNVDPNRVYLMGHSMGGIGTWHLGAKYADVWAAIAPFAGFGLPETVARMKGIAQIVIHGDADPTVSVGGSRAMVEKMKELGIEHRYIEVKGGNHSDVVAPNFAAMFDFFDAHRRKAAPSQ